MDALQINADTIYNIGSEEIKARCALCQGINGFTIYFALLLIGAEDELQIKQSSPFLERISGFIVSKGLQQLALRGPKQK